MSDAESDPWSGPSAAQPDHWRSAAPHRLAFPTAMPLSPATRSSASHGPSSASRPTAWRADSGRSAFVAATASESGQPTCIEWIVMHMGMRPRRRRSGQREPRLPLARTAIHSHPLAHEGSLPLAATTSTPTTRRFSAARATALTGARTHHLLRLARVAGAPRRRRASCPIMSAPRTWPISSTPAAPLACPRA